MARIYGEVTPEAMASAVASEQAAPTGAMHMVAEVDSGNVEALQAACMQMIQAHPGG